MMFSFNNAIKKSDELDEATHTKLLTNNRVKFFLKKISKPRIKIWPFHDGFVPKPRKSEIIQYNLY